MVNVNGVLKVERYNAYLEKLEAVRDVYSCGNDLSYHSMDYPRYRRNNHGLLP